MSDFIKIGPKSKFILNQTTGLQVNNIDICIANNNGQLTAFDDSCTHAQAMLSGCDIEEGGEVACPLHGARFSVKTGEAITLPAVRSVRMHEIKIQGDDVFVKLSDKDPETI